jgi:signal transduction histidine kinase/CheY-like chemotaxis protein/HPt (histidine-containing phosphotransfer) domain-containing protein
MTGAEQEPGAPAASPVSALPVYLDPAEAEREKQRRARRLHLVTVPATRLAGFSALLLLVYLHNRFLVGEFSWRAYLGLAGVLIGWALIGWLLLYRLYDRLGDRLAFALLFGDLAMFILVIHATGDETSWFFFILVVRAADVAYLSARQQLIFANAAVLSYVALLAWLAGVEGRSLEWPDEAAKIAVLWVVCLYLVFTRRIVERLQAQTAAAMRTARDLARRLEEAWRRAEMLSAAKSRFLATMSHELRSPLHAIIGSTHLVQDTGLRGEQQRYFTAILASAQGLLYTVNQILDFFRVEAGKIELERHPFRLRQALEPIVQSLGVRAEERGLDLAVKVDDDVPDELVGDAGSLHQVLTNLVDNALKFSERGSVSLSVRLMARRPASVSLRFAVADTGIGIRPEDRGLIFEAFAQAPTPGARSLGGAGLGLAIAAELVRRMGGELRVESELGRGSTFHFTIDFALTEAVAAPPNAMRPAARVAAEGLRPGAREASRRLRVLVVDDEPMSAEVARVAFERRGHAVVVAKTGQEAIEAFDRTAFDAVLMDVQLPDGDGVATTAILRDRERHIGRRARIVVLTASAMPGDRERSLAAEIDAYLVKPVDPRTLITAVEAASPEEELDATAGTRITGLFLTEAPRQLDDVQDAIARRDHAALLWAAHRLKGAIANFGASPTLDAAQRLEDLAERGGAGAADVTWASLEEQCGCLGTALTALLEKMRAAPA